VTFSVPWDSTIKVRGVSFSDGKRATLAGEDPTGNQVTEEFPTDGHAVRHIKEGNGRVRFGDGSVRVIPVPRDSWADPWWLAAVGSLLAFAALVIGGVWVARHWSARRVRGPAAPRPGSP
jgi:hypothetical protein